MIDEQTINTFWQRYLAARGEPEGKLAAPEAWSFGDNPALADELCQLVLSGIKTATCSLLWEYEADGEALPQEGQLSIILDGQGKPSAVIETTQVIIQPFNQVDASFAYEEGEDDRSLESWRTGTLALFFTHQPIQRLATGREHASGVRTLQVDLSRGYSEQRLGA